MDRHTLFKTSNKQHIEIAKLNSWNPSEEQTAVTQRHGTGLLQSQIVEDVIWATKNDVSTRAHNKYKRPSHPPLPRKLRIQSGVHPAFQLLRCLSFKSINSLGCVQTFMCLFHGYFRWWSVLYLFKHMTAGWFWFVVYFPPHIVFTFSCLLYG